MSFFKLNDKGQLSFGEYSKKHGGETVEKVARADPKYVQWARRERTVGLAPNLFDMLDDVMTANGVPFSSKKKNSPPRKS